MSKPIAVSMGDPAGIGLELIAKSANAADFFVIADPDALARAAERARLALKLKTIAHPEDWSRGEALCVLAEPLAVPEQPGQPDPRNAPAVTRAIERGVGACLSGAASAIVTAPIAKATLYEAGFSYGGHTEFVGALTEQTPFTGARGPVMMLASPELRVALVTIHEKLTEVPKLLTKERITRVARVVADALRRDFGIASPRIALAGLNPHAGEDGKIGREELEIINPAAAQLRSEGIDARDASAADTLFHAEARASYDAVIAMYHDQGLIPLKTLSFWDGVNVTLGLPIVRTSPDHGTAFDIAGKGVARADSFIAALKMAQDMAGRRAKA